MQEYYKIQNLTIYTEIYGQGKSVILLHGWGQTHAFWDNIIDSLSEKYKLYVLDLPGFGYSEEPSSIWSVKDYSDFLHNFVKYFKIDNPIIIGHSFGGRIAAYYASEYSVNKLILYSTSGLNKLSLLTRMYKIIVKYLKNITPNQLYVLQSWIFKPKSYENKQIVSKHRSKIMLDIYLRHFENLEEIYKKITIPTFLIYGENDFIVKPMVGKTIHGLIKNSEFIIIPAATHFAHIENANTFNKIIEKFLQ